MKNTYFIIGRKTSDTAAPEFVFIALGERGMIFTERLMSANAYNTAEEAERALKSTPAKDREGCEVLEVFARRRKTS